MNMMTMDCVACGMEYNIPMDCECLTFVEEGPKPLDFKELRQTNVDRCEEVFHGVDEWSPTDWGCVL